MKKYRLGILVVLLFAACYFADWSQDHYDYSRTFASRATPPILKYGVKSSGIDIGPGIVGNSAFMSNLPYGSAITGDASGGSLNSRLMNGFNSSSRLSLGNAAYGTQGGADSSFASPSATGAAVNPLGSFGTVGNGNGLGSTGLSGTGTVSTSGFSSYGR